MSEQERIHIPSDDEVLAVERHEVLGARIKYFSEILNSPDHKTWTYYPKTPGVPSFSFPAKYAKDLFAKVEYTIDRSLTDSGVNDGEWTVGWGKMIRNETPIPSFTEEGTCMDGHRMLRRSSAYWLCPLDGQITWEKEL